MYRYKDLSVWSNAANKHTFVCISSSVTMQNWHFLKAEPSGLNPPTDQAARLSAENTVIVPRQDTCWSPNWNCTPLSYTMLCI